jgi:hypothetical protein
MLPAFATATVPDGYFGDTMHVELYMAGTTVRARNLAAGVDYATHATGIDAREALFWLQNSNRYKPYFRDVRPTE